MNIIVTPDGIRSATYFLNEKMRHCRIKIVAWSDSVSMRDKMAIQDMLYYEDAK